MSDAVSDAVALVPQVPAAPVTDREAALEAAVVRWGLDVCPPDPRNAPEGVTPLIAVNPQLKPEVKRRVRKMVQAMGTPLDVVRGMVAKEPPAEWERDLRAISPVTDATSHLIFAWKEPLLQPDRGRWCLYEAIPDTLIATERRMELAGPPFWALPKEERAAQATIVSAYQWVMYQQHRVDVRPFWCLQGSEGGTPLHHSPLERRYLRMMQKPEWPLPVGELPYAPWDARVRAAVLERDRLHKLGGSVGALRGSGASAAQRTAEAEQAKAYRRAFWDWFSEKLGPATELYAHILKHEDPDRQRQSAADAIAAAEAREVFIETGRVPDPHEYRHRKLVIAR